MGLRRRFRFLVWLCGSNLEWSASLGTRLSRADPHPSAPQHCAAFPCRAASRDQTASGVEMKGTGGMLSCGSWPMGAS